MVSYNKNQLGHTMKSENHVLFEITHLADFEQILTSYLIENPMCIISDCAISP